MPDPVVKEAVVLEHVLLSPEGKITPYLDLAFERGRGLGEQAGYAASRSEVAALVALMQTISKKLIEQRGRLLEELKPQLVEFCIAVCERVIRQELSHPERLAHLIDSLLTSVAPALEGDFVKIVVSSQDLEMLSEASEQLRGVRFVSDPLMPRGDCRIETKTRLVNGSIVRQLEDLRARVLRQ